MSEPKPVSEESLDTPPARHSAITRGRGSMRELLEFSGRGIDERGFGREEMADAEDLVVGRFPALLLDRLADGGDRLDAVAGVEARGIDLPSAMSFSFSAPSEAGSRAAPPLSQNFASAAW